MYYSAVCWWLRSCYSSGRYNEWNTGGAPSAEVIMYWKTSHFCITIEGGSGPQFLTADHPYVIPGVAPFCAI